MRWRLIQKLILPVLLVVIVTSIDWVETPLRTWDRASTDMAELKADYFLEKFKTISYDANGDPEYVLTGNTLLHYPSRNASELTAPVVILNRQKQPAWTLKSTRGWFDEISEAIRLEGEVFIYRKAFADNPEVVITTSEVTVQTQSRIIKSANKVKVQSQDWTLHSDGFKSNIVDGKLSLLSNVRAHYETKQ